MFFDCEDISGTIPDDMFSTTAIGSKFNNLSNVSRMFQQCYNLYYDENRTTDMSFVSQTLFSKCPRLANVSHLFQAVGYNIAKNNKPYSLVLNNDMFNGCVTLVNVGYLFARMDKLKVSTDGNFMRDSLGSIENAQYSFMNTLISQIGQSFDETSSIVLIPGSGINNKIRNIHGIFSRINNDNTFDNTVIYYNSYFSALSDYTGAFYNQQFPSPVTFDDSTWTAQPMNYGESSLLKESISLNV